MSTRIGVVVYTADMETALPLQPAWKRPLYLALTTMLGIITSFGLHAVAELWYLSYADARHWTIRWTLMFGFALCSLPWYVQYGLLTLGIVGGFLIGRVWWQLVYVEGKRSRQAPMQ